MFIPTFSCGIPEIDRSFKLALGTLAANVSERRPCDTPCGLLAHGGPVIIAGLEYEDPWTRDTSFNTWYAGSLLMPEIAKNTLLSVIDRTDTGYFIRGGYWDAIIWVHAAWEYFLRTGERDFLAFAHDVAHSALAFYEETELDEDDHLFRGGACFMDGISAYPDKFLTHDGASGIYNCKEEMPRPAYLVDKGNGIPCKALSTNCLFYMAYKDANLMRRELGLEESAEWNEKAAILKDAIQGKFFDAGRQRWRYLLDSDDPDPEREEGLGHAFLMLSGLADDAMSCRINRYAHRTPQGIPCVWPTFERYAKLPEKYGRHSGTIWPQVNAAWVLGLCEHGLWREAWPEILLQAKRADRDFSFFELYHPETGLPFAGLQEYYEEGICQHYPSNHGQTWAATGFLAMIFRLLCGMTFTASGLKLSPHLPDGVDKVHIEGLPYRQATISLLVSRDKTLPAKTLIPADAAGTLHLNLQG